MYKKTNNKDGYWIYGKNPSLAALLNTSRKILEIVLIPATKEWLQGNGIQIEKLKVPYQIVTNEAISMILPYNSIHQGIAIKSLPLKMHTLHEFLDKNRDRSKSIIVACDQITDSNNFGAILRNCAAFGIDGILITTKNQVQECSGVAKAAAGTLEKNILIGVVNLAESLRDLKKAGYWVIGLDADGNANFAQCKSFDKIVLVLGSENNGIRHLTNKNCDIILKIPMKNGVESLNVASACAITLYCLTSL